MPALVLLAVGLATGCGAAAIRRFPLADPMSVDPDENRFGRLGSVVGVREQDYHDRYTRPDKLQEGEEIAWPVPYWHFDAGAAATAATGRRRPLSTTVAPSRASALAPASPIPVPAPVTHATLPSS